MIEIRKDQPDPYVLGFVSKGRAITLDWATIQQSMRPGTTVRKWSAKKGFLDGSFTVTAVTPASVTVDSPGAKNLQTVPKADFEKVLVIWDRYLAGTVQRIDLRETTRYSTYVIGIIHHVFG